MPQFRHFKALIILLSISAFNASVGAATIMFNQSDFSLATVFSNVQTFSFSIELEGDLVAGTNYLNPTLDSVNYQVNGSLAVTPSGFPAFNLVRNINGADFYAQGSSFEFEIKASADLTDGLQVVELVANGDGRLFRFNAREFEQFPPRYHPPLVELFDDGSGRIQNSNNQGKPTETNPDSGFPVDVDFGDEYITDLIFSSATLTLAGPQVVVPIPAALPLFLSALGLLVCRRKFFSQ